MKSSYCHQSFSSLLVPQAQSRGWVQTGIYENAYTFVTQHLMILLQCVTHWKDLKAATVPNLNRVATEVKSQQSESDGQDSLMVQRPIEMVSYQDTISASTFRVPLKRQKGDTSENPTQDLRLKLPVLRHWAMTPTQITVPNLSRKMVFDILMRIPLCRKVNTTLPYRMLSNL